MTTSAQAPAAETSNRESPVARRRFPRTVVRGAVAGALATAPMTLAMLLLHRGALAPERVSRQLWRRAGGAAAEPEARSTFDAAWMASHVAFGAGAGVLYANLRAPMRQRAALCGAGFGAALWATSYVAVLPALSLYPAVADDHRGRRRGIAASHLVYGTALGVIEDTLRRPRQRS
jgi:hypothetical protein